MRFIVEVDKLKSVLRRSRLMNGTRLENSAEHSWHLALMAIILSEHAPVEIDTARVIKMVVVHDIVEVDAGDTYVYDEIGALTKADREQKAADRIFGLLPDDQRDEIMALWQEFEARETPEAKFGDAIDRLMPLLHNYHNEGRTWREHGVTAEQVLRRNEHIAGGSPALWEFAESFLRDADERGFMAQNPSGPVGPPSL